MCNKTISWGNSAADWLLGGAKKSLRWRNYGVLVCDWVLKLWGLERLDDFVPVQNDV